MQLTSIGRVGGALGPAAFTTAWLTLGAGADATPVREPISRLAARGAPTRPAMTAAMLAAAAGIGVFSSSARPDAPTVAAAAAIHAAALTGIAVTPLDDNPNPAHVVAAATAYASLVATTLAVARHDQRDRRVVRAAIGTTVAAVTAITLTASVTSRSRTGLWQRVGLTAGHAWITAAALHPSHPAP